MARQATLGTIRTVLTSSITKFREGMTNATRKTKEQQRAMARLKRQFDRTSRSADRYVRSLFSIRGAAVAVLGGGLFGGFIRDTANLSAKLRELQISTGISFRSIQTLGRAFEADGAKLQDFSKSVNTLARRLGEAAQGSPEYTRQFRDLGVEVTDAEGRIRSIEEVYREVIRKLGDLSVAESQVNAELLLGRGARTLLPAIRRGYDEVLAQEAREAQIAGVVAVGEAIRNKDLAQAFVDLENSIDNARQRVVSTFAPDISIALRALAQQLTDNVDNITQYIFRITGVFRRIAGEIAIVVTTLAFRTRINAILTFFRSLITVMASAATGATLLARAGGVIIVAFQGVIKVLSIFIKTIAGPLLIVESTLQLIRTLKDLKEIADDAGVSISDLFTATIVGPDTPELDHAVGRLLQRIDDDISNTLDGYEVLGRVALGLEIDEDSSFKNLQRELEEYTASIDEDNLEYALGSIITIDPQLVIATGVRGKIDKINIDLEKEIRASAQTFDLDLALQLGDITVRDRNIEIRANQIVNELLDREKNLVSEINQLVALTGVGNARDIQSREDRLAKIREELGIVRGTLGEQEKIRENLLQTIKGQERLNNLHKISRENLFESERISRSRSVERQGEETLRVLKKELEFLRLNKSEREVQTELFRIQNIYLRQEAELTDRLNSLRALGNQGSPQVVKDREEEIERLTLLIEVVRRLATESKKTNEERVRGEVAVQRQVEATMEYYNRLRAAADSVGEAFSTFFEDMILNAKSASDAIKSLTNAILRAALEAAVLAPIRAGIGAAVSGFLGVPAAASGGRQFGPTLVGEQGPELVDFRRPGQVYPAGITQDILNGVGQRGGGQIVNFNVNSTDGPGVRAAILQFLPIIRQDVLNDIRQDASRRGNMRKVLSGRI